MSHGHRSMQERNLELRRHYGTGRAQKCAEGEDKPIPVVGFQNSTGIIRKPDPALMSARKLEQELDKLTKWTRDLGRANHRAVNFFAREVSGPVDSLVSEWEHLSARFRVLTSSCLASGIDDIDLCIRVYEGAADGALTGGNLTLYLLFQSRLLNDLYPRFEEKAGRRSKRQVEFLGYFFLYFGCFSFDLIEVNQRMRGLDPDLVKEKDIRFGFSVTSCFSTGNYATFSRLYDIASWKQKTLMAPARASMRKRILKTIMKAYMQLENRQLERIMDATSEDLRKLIGTLRPDLIDVNGAVGSTVFKFRRAEN